MFVGLTIKSFECFAHHVEFGLAVPLENCGMALPEHQCNAAIRHAASAEPGCKRMAQLVEREIRHPGSLQRAAPNFLEAKKVRFPSPLLCGAETDNQSRQSLPFVLWCPFGNAA
jgi:hypothetical protein